MTLEKVEVLKKSLSEYTDVVGEDIISEIRKLGETLFGKRIVHINATPKGGGVAEILQSLIPLLQDIGFDAEWHVINPPVEFFTVSKKLHNALQGDTTSISQEELDFYLEINKSCGDVLDYLDADLFVVHDPQPLAGLHYSKHNTPAISRIHIDLSTPSPQILDFIMPYLLEYDKTIFSLDSFVPPEFPKDKVVIIPPAIDPLARKNILMDKNDAKNILSSFGIDLERPIISQVSRFDPWKDPKGVIDAYRIAKEKISGLQLILLGISAAKDDPEADKIFREVELYVDDDPDIFLFFSPSDLRDVTNDDMVRAVQTGSDIILQKSTREGFGLTATEALWKGVPLIAGNVSGLALQIENSKSGILVDSPEEAAEAVLKLISDKDFGNRLGKSGHQNVLDNYLITRLLRDHVELYGNLIS